MPDGVCIKDMQGRVVLGNAAHALAFQSESVGGSGPVGTPAETAQSAAELEVLKSGNPMRREFDRVHPENGRRTWWQATLMPLKNADGMITGLAVFSHDITDRREAVEKIESLHKQLTKASRMAGMAEVATGVLHNVGNVLTSVKVSARLVMDNTRKSKVVGISKLSALLKEHAHDLGKFLSEDSKGRQVPAYLHQLSEHLMSEQSLAMQELESLTQNIEHISQIVARQQTYAASSEMMETVNVEELVEDAMRIHERSYIRHGVHVVRDYSPVPPVFIDKHKLLQILVNLFSNAIYATDQTGRTDKQMTVRFGIDEENKLRIEVSDNGIGISPENMARMFSYGFTTRKDGHGFGLHSSALAAQEMGGSLMVRSAGAGQGATFIIQLPNRRA